jgi:RNA polymerase sigma-70 factor (ECF subfamily)
VENQERADIRASLKGDEEAYARLVRRHEKRLTRLAWRFTRDPAECEELVQQVFVEAYFSLGTYRGHAPFVHWLQRIATRVGYRFWKERARRQQYVSLADFDAIEEVDEDRIDPAEAAAVLEALLARLPADDRLVLTLMYFEQCGTQEIAERTGWSRAKVKTRALRARRKIKAIAERERVLERLGWTR